MCPLEQWIPDQQMQAIALENNLPQTAFFVGENGQYALRWFTPATEVDLCGHATLASAFVLMNCLSLGEQTVSFETRSGTLTVTREGDRYALDFPARLPERCQPHPRLVEALGTAPLEILAARDYFVVYRDESEVRTLKPNMELLAQMDRFGVIVTAPGTEGVDFVSRFFAPARGVPEDPVTGSAHCTLIPYWAKRLNKTRLHALQVSPRGGELFCEERGDRVIIAGRAALYLEGTIRVG